MFEWISRYVLNPLGTVFAAKIIHDLYYHQWSDTKRSLEKDTLHALMHAPIAGSILQKKIHEETDPILQEAALHIAGSRTRNPHFQTLPEDPIPAEVLIEELGRTLHAEFNPETYYKTSGPMYCPQNNEAFNALVRDVYDKAKYTNTLYPNIWPRMQECGADVVHMCLNMFQAPDPDEAFGCLTPGGTYSILSACHAYLKRHQERKSTLKRLFTYVFDDTPEIVVPTSAHPAFDKAAELLGFRLIKVPVDPVTQRADVEGMKRAITKNTLFLVGSVPSYPTGTMDNIEALAKIAKAKGIGLHVDACLGGFIAPFMKEAGYPLPFKFGFDVEGVTSISLDPHKQGGAEKGSSVILYNNRKDLGQYQNFTYMDWSGGYYATHEIGGSGSGVSYCNTWAVMLHKGHKSFVTDARNIRKLIESVQRKIKSQVPQIQVYGESDINILALTSNMLSVHVIADLMQEAGWQLKVLPNNVIHLCFTGVHIAHSGFAKEFVNDLASCVQTLHQQPDRRPMNHGALYGSKQAMPKLAAPIFEEVARDYIGLNWSTFKQNSTTQNPLDAENATPLINRPSKIRR